MQRHGGAEPINSFVETANRIGRREQGGALQKKLRGRRGDQRECSVEIGDSQRGELQGHECAAAKDERFRITRFARERSVEVRAGFGGAFRGKFEFATDTVETRMIRRQLGRSTVWRTDAA